ncbi:MAG: hypothetical protein ACLP7Q_16105 [Isosphaeraceae bacterium]
MRSTLKIVAMLGIVLTSLVNLDRRALAGAQQETRLTRSSRGGLLATADGRQFEIFFFPTGVRVFPLNDAGGPINTSRLTGSATFYHPDAPSRPWFARPLSPEPATVGHVPSSMDLKIGLANAPQKGATVVVELVGLSSQTGSAVTFTVPLDFVTVTAPQPAAPQGETASGPRYVYGPGYYGYGYYAYPGPETLPQPAMENPISYSTPGRYTIDSTMSGHTVGWMHRDWTTGRSSPLAKPWLRPRD